MTTVYSLFAIAAEAFLLWKAPWWGKAGSVFVYFLVVLAIRANKEHLIVANDLLYSKLAEVGSAVDQVTLQLKVLERQLDDTDRRIRGWPKL